MKQIINATNIKLFIGSIVTVFLVFFSWKITYSYSCWSLFFPIVLLATIAYGLIEIKSHQRNCFKNCYFKEDSFFAKLLSSKIMMIIFYLLASIVLTISTMHSIIDYPIELWLYIIFHTIIVIAIFKLFNRLLANTVRSKYLYLFSREATINIAILLLITIYLYTILNGYAPAYLRDNLESTIETATKSINSQCYIIDYVLRLKTELDAFLWWSVIKSSNIFVWVGFIIINGLTVIGINRFIVQIVYILDKIFSPKQENDQQ